MTLGSPSLAPPTALPGAFVPVFNGTTYGKQAANKRCNVARSMNLAQRVGFLVRSAP